MNCKNGEFDLKHFGLKVTKPRVAILELFQKKENKHLSAEKVYELLRIDHLDVGIATVYRVLSQFEDVGILLRLNFDGQQSYYELNDSKHHDHIICLKCNAVEEFYDAGIEALQEAVVNRMGGRLLNHSMHLYIECKKCQTNLNTK
jgi:Fur family transcriptional regulator, ferric uptake regulator